MNGLGVVRNLGRNGVDVCCVTDEKDPVIYSAFCKKRYILPHASEGEAPLRRFLAKIRARTNGCAVLLPTSDAYCLLLSSLEDELDSGFYVPLPPYEVVRTLVDKREFYQSLSQHRVPHPVTHFPESQEEAMRISKEMGYPVFVKPCMSHVFSQKFPKRKGFVARSKEELEQLYVLMKRLGVDVLIQEIVPEPDEGNMLGVEEYFDRNHIPIASFAFRKVRGWPPTFGLTSLRESIPMQNVAALCESVNRYLRNLEYHGLMEAEWKRDSRDNRFKLLEINARQSMQNSLPARCGINLILIAYLDAIGLQYGHPDGYSVGRRWIDFLGDLASALRTGNSILDWVRSTRKAEEWSFFARDDLAPWIMNSINTLSRMITSPTSFATMAFSNSTCESHELD